MITFSATTVLVLALIAAVVIAIGLWAYSTANRLDRLHVRSDQSWQALDAALSRRAVVARAVASALADPGADPAALDRAKLLAMLADRAERAGRLDREAVENQLSAALSAVDSAALRPQMVAELADAEARVLIARRFHNDAVRDTLALRTRRPVRILHLGGTAPLPTYFEITERATPAASTGLDVDTTRTTARIVLFDENDRTLLMRGNDPKTPDTSFWFTVGGGVEPGESLRDAAVRELYEETGHRADPESLRGPIWRRVAVFPFDGDLIRSEELFFALRVPGYEPQATNLTAIERRSITGNKWCTVADIVALDRSGETVYPYNLDELLAEAAAAASGTIDPEVRSIR
ncbi:putative hydrolase, nudix family protein [Nocardia brasiliensis ATCC 700358]|uniref:Putative hydrolase, nudix family protein n=1 Tax=Nocardia brasiliensis (strain ATCC 700358 / HUJEG-1) TaxID=1133849 RepID=K0F2Q0_NOCB7|nr:putative hydrolase, nudix family protein [Nocardia brasiliensis ATCC 700358]